MVKLGRIPKTSFNDTVSIVIRVAYRTGIFGDANNIEIAYQLAYQKIIRNGNYLELSEKETVTQLLSYIENTPYLKLSSKGKNKDSKNITSLILLTGTAGSVSPILSAYIQQITLLEFNTRSNSSFLGNWFENNRQNLAFQLSHYNFNYNIMSRYQQNYYRDPYGYEYIQRPPTYNYARYYQQPQYNYQQLWGQVPVATTQPL